MDSYQSFDVEGASRSAADASVSEPSPRAAPQVQMRSNRNLCRVFFCTTCCVVLPACALRTGALPEPLLSGGGVARPPGAGGHATTGAKLPALAETGAVSPAVASVSKPAPKKLRITPQIVLTAKERSLRRLPRAARANVQRTLDMNPKLKPRILGDAECRGFLNAHDPELAEAFRGERRGSYRGDICRAAVLFEEGGVYVDVDLQPKVPFSAALLGAADFVSAVGESGDVLNAFMAAAPRSPVLRATIAAMKRYYRGEALGRGWDWMGPYTLCAGLQQVCSDNATRSRLRRSKCVINGVAPGDHKCGGHSVRLFKERRLQCNNTKNGECPLARKQSDFIGLKYGIFDTRGRKESLVAWSRFVACQRFGCGSGGWDIKRRRLRSRGGVPLLRGTRLPGRRLARLARAHSGAAAGRPGQREQRGRGGARVGASLSR